MQYALLIYTKPGAAEALGAAEQEAVHREYLDIKQVPGMVGGAALHPVETATTVRVQDGRTLVPERRFLERRIAEVLASWSVPPGRQVRDRAGAPRTVRCLSRPSASS